jgi:hypothetical protein
MRLFRQEAFGDWDGVFRRMAGALMNVLAEDVRARPLAPGWSESPS